MAQLVAPAAANAETAPAAGAQLELSITGLEDLGPGWAYEGWLIENGQPVSTGVFTINPEGVPSATRFPVHGQDLSTATAFVLTIESSPGPHPTPSATHLLGGDFAQATAHLSVAHPAALGSDFSDASGSFILAAPTAAGDGASYKNGIWWLDPQAGPGPSLRLPTLPAGWAYEGWVVGPDGPISTGRFQSVTGPDSDGPGAAAGPQPAPPFPGQDFLQPPRDLTAGYAAVVSIEPEPDNSPAPFTLKPLVTRSIADAGEGVLQVMANNARTFPTGTARLTFGEPHASDGRGLSNEPLATQALFRAVWGDRAAERWADEHTAELARR